MLERSTSGSCLDGREVEVDCPWSGPGLVWPLFADPGPGHKLFFQNFYKFLRFKLIFSYFLSIFSPQFNDICCCFVCHCDMLSRYATLFLPTSNFPATKTITGNDINSNKSSRVTTMMVRVHPAQESSRHV